MCDGDDVRAFIDEFKPDPSDPSPVEDVTIVMDKQTGMSKRFGFVRFITLEHARGKLAYRTTRAQRHLLSSSLRQCHSFRGSQLRSCLLEVAWFT